MFDSCAHAEVLSAVKTMVPFVLWYLIKAGTRQRTTAATLFNTESSRSHAVFELNVQCKYKGADGADMRSTSRLALIDLAGSERSSKLGSKGSALKEGNNINKIIL